MLTMSADILLGLAAEYAGGSKPDTRKRYEWMQSAGAALAGCRTPIGWTMVWNGCTHAHDLTPHGSPVQHDWLEEYAVELSDDGRFVSLLQSCPTCGAKALSSMDTKPGAGIEPYAYTAYKDLPTCGSK